MDQIKMIENGSKTITFITKIISSTGVDGL